MSLFPPDTLCYVLARNMSQVVNCDNSSVTPGMINYLNLTTSIDSYIQGYCLNPQPDDSCPFGFCPQPDIVGLFVRISNYITTLCLSILLIFGTKQEDITTAFSSSLLNTLSLLITSGITIIQGNFSRFHAWLAFYLATPPLQVVLFGYSLASFLGFRGHRLERSVGAGKVVQRTLVVLGMLASVALLIYVLVPDTATHFAQESCEATSFFLRHKYFIALNLVVTGVKISRFWLIIALVPFVIQIITVIVVIWRGDYKDDDFVSDFRRKHSLMFFFNVVVGPYVWWVGTIESVLRESPSDSTFSPSFGQILALFVAIPPLISVLHFSRLNWQGSEDSKYDAPQPYVQGSDSQISLAPAQGRQSQSDGYRHYNY